MASCADGRKFRNVQRCTARCEFILSNFFACQRPLNGRARGHPLLMRRVIREGAGEHSTRTRHSG